MPRKGPPKSTTRGDREAEKKTLKKEEQRQELKAERAVEAVKKYDSVGGYEMPDTKAECKSLRAGLKLRGDELHRYGESNVKSNTLIMKSSEVRDPKSRGEVRQEMNPNDCDDYDL
jgi:hypothetical protein